MVSRIRQSNFSQGPWAELINDIQADCANGDVPRIHLFGSIFGGTGSSGLPTLGTLLSRELKGVRSSVQITASVLLPYFDFDIPDDDDIYAEAKNFTLNTDAALQYMSRLRAIVSLFSFWVTPSNSVMRNQRREAQANNPSSSVDPWPVLLLLPMLSKVMEMVLI